MGFLSEVEKRLDLPQAEKARVMAELGSHWNEVRDELLASGMDEASAKQQADGRFGTPEEVAARLSAVHSTASWRSALLAAGPFAGAALVSLCTGLPEAIYCAAVALFGSIMVAGSTRELLRGRRPIWLATWLAASLTAARVLVETLFGRTSVTVRSTHYATVRILMPGATVMAIAFVIVMVAVLWRNRKWRLAAVSLGAVHTAFTVYSYYARSRPSLYLAARDNVQLVQLLVLGDALVLAALVVMFAWSVFASHRYGSASQSSLFLLAYLTVGLASPPRFALITVAAACIGAVMVMWYARSGRTYEKLAIVSIAVLLLSAFPLGSHFQYALPGIAHLRPETSVLVSMATYGFVWAFPQVIAPLVIDLMGQRKASMKVAA